MEALRALGEDVWFNLGDRDLGDLPARARRLAAGESLTEIADDAAARARRAGAGAADERRPGPHVDHGPRPLGDRSRSS